MLCLNVIFVSVLFSVSKGCHSYFTDEWRLGGRWKGRWKATASNHPLISIHAIELSTPRSLPAIRLIESL